MDTPYQEISLKDALGELRVLGRKVAHDRTRTMRDYLDEIFNDQLRRGLLALHDNYPFATVCAGAKHHHWWEGGLNDHCVEMVQLGLDLKALYHRELQFVTHDDLIAAVFLHDFSKVFIYRKLVPADRDRAPGKFHVKQVFTYQEGATDILDAEHLTATTLMRHSVAISDKVWSSVVFAEGGFSKAHFGFGGQPTKTGSTVNHENPLAAFVHILDIYSAMFLGETLK